MRVLKSVNVDDKVKLAVSLNKDGDLVGSVVIKSEHLVDLLSKRIPGGIDDLVLQAVLAQLKRMGSAA